MAFPVRTVSAITFLHRNVATCVVLLEERVEFNEGQSEEQTGSIVVSPVAEFNVQGKTPTWMLDQLHALADRFGALRIQQFELHAATFKVMSSYFRTPTRIEGQDTATIVSAKTASSGGAINGYLTWQRKMLPNMSFAYQAFGSEFPDFLDDDGGEVIVAYESGDDLDRRRLLEDQKTAPPNAVTGTVKKWFGR